MLNPFWRQPKQSRSAFSESFIAGQWSRAMNKALSSGGMGAFTPNIGDTCDWPVWWLRCPSGWWGVWPLSAHVWPGVRVVSAPVTRVFSTHYWESDPDHRDIIASLTSLSAPVTLSHHWPLSLVITTSISNPSHSATSKCRQRYLNLSSTLPKIPTKIYRLVLHSKELYFMGIRKHLFTDDWDWNLTKLLLFMNDGRWLLVSATIIGLSTIHCLWGDRGNEHENCSKNILHIQSCTHTACLAVHLGVTENEIFCQLFICFARCFCELCTSQLNNK